MLMLVKVYHSNGWSIRKMNIKDVVRSVTHGIRIEILDI